MVVTCIDLCPLAIQVRMLPSSFVHGLMSECSHRYYITHSIYGVVVQYTQYTGVDCVAVSHYSTS